MTHTERARDSKSKSRWYIKHENLNSGGYDSMGGYWGSAGGGQRLYYVYNADGNLGFYIRGTKDTARAAYQWVRASSDPAAACRYIDATGKIGGY